MEYCLYSEAQSNGLGGMSNGGNGVEWDRTILQMDGKQKRIPGLINMYVHAPLRGHLGLAIDISESGTKPSDTRRRMLIQRRLICIVR